MQKISFFVPQINHQIHVNKANGLNFIQFSYRGKLLSFLLDTGASISVIFENYLNKCEKIDYSKETQIHGISGSTVSKGKVSIQLQHNKISLTHEFLLMHAFNESMHGMLGSDFFNKYFANIDFETFSFSFWVNNNKISLPIHSEYELLTTIPSRCEVIKYFYAGTADECVVLPGELCDGVFAAGGIVRPDKHNMIPVKILNTRDEVISLKNFKPKLDSLQNYDLLTFQENKHSVNRIENLLNIVKTQH